MQTDWYVVALLRPRIQELIWTDIREWPQSKRQNTMPREPTMHMADTEKCTIMTSSSHGTQRACCCAYPFHTLEAAVALYT